MSGLGRAAYDYALRITQSQAGSGGILRGGRSFQHTPWEVAEEAPDADAEWA